jgi:hypothetical protein
MADPEYREQGSKWWMKAGGGGWKKVDAEEVNLRVRMSCVCEREMRAFWPSPLPTQ